MIASPHDLTYFIELSNTLNFSRASERIGISQPSLSAAIKRLEQSIGTPLCLRGKTGVTLTPAGKRLLSHAKSLLQLWESVKSETLASQHEIQGSFQFGIHPSAALHSLHGFLPDLLTKYPKLEIKLKHDLSRKLAEGVINLSIDLAIVANPIRHPDLVITKLYEDQVTFWCKSNAKNIDQQLQSGNAVLICDPDMMQTQWLMKRLQKDGCKFNRVVSSSNLEVIASLTASGAGIGILPASIAASCLTKQLKAISHLPSYHDDICLIYRHENRNVKAMQELINTIKMYFKNKQ